MITIRIVIKVKLVLHGNSCSVVYLYVIFIIQHSFDVMNTKTDGESIIQATYNCYLVLTH